MSKQQQLLALIVAALFALAASPAHAAEYVIITDPSMTTPESAVSELNANLPVLLDRPGRSGGGSLRGSRAQRPKFRSKVSLGSKQHFGLLDDVEEEDVAMLKTVPGVLDVVPNINISTAAASIEGERTTQWNLDRVDQSFGSDGMYFPAKEDGTGVDIYIIDSGVRRTHTAFGNRVQDGYSAVFTEMNGANDCNGHGTHVASTAAGVGYGIARGATIYPVQILNCAGSGSLMGMASGVSWVLENIRKLGSAKRSVVNLSIQAVANSGVDELVRQLYNAGAVVVVAAANFNSDACNYSPAREPLAVTVGATSQDDSKLPSSNFGPCVNLFAPGDDVIGASISGDSDSTEKQGTSMASPLVVGVVATLRQKYPTYSNADIIKELVGTLATTIQSKQVMDLDCGGTVPNVKFLQTLSASTPAPASSLARGSELRSDFKNWAPELMTQSKDGSICVTFSAKIDKLYNAERSGEALASMRILLGTDVLPMGLTNYLSTSLSCRTLTSRWYVFENGPSHVSVSDFQSNLVGARANHATYPSQELSLSTTADFYLSLKVAGDGTTLTFGRGDGTSDRTSEQLLSVVDRTSKMTASSFKYLSFSTPNSQDVLFSNIRSCNGNGPITTKPDETSGGGLPVPVPTLTVNAEQVSTYNLWPTLWTKPSISAPSCLAFSVDMGIAGVFSVAMANQPLGALRTGSFSGVPLNSMMYEFQITRTRTMLFRNGILLASSKNRLVIGKKAKLVYFRASLTNGRIQVELYRNGKWRVNFAYTKDMTALDTGAGKRMSLASSQPRTFSTITVC